MRRQSAGAMETALWALVGAAAGLAAGFALAGWTGRVSGARVRSTARRVTAPLRGTAPRPAGPAGPLARAADAALAADLQLAAFELTCRPLGAAGLEVHGWVPSRALRARAARLVQGVEGVEHVVNCLLVRGEDDRDPLPDESEPAPQTA